MKVYISKYRNHWLSPYTICEKLCWWREIDYDEPWVKRTSDILNPVCELWQKFLDLVHPRIEYVKIDPWDVWSMDSTLAPIILPMLKELKRVKHGAPYTEDSDVPERLRSTTKSAQKAKKESWDTDGNHFRRWDWILDEMIWAFEQLNDDDHEAPFFDHSKARDPKDSLDKQVRKIKVDRVGLKKHNERLDNGLRLFGKYFRALWD